MKRALLVTLTLLGVLLVFTACAPKPICEPDDLMPATLVAPGFWEVVDSLTPTLSWNYPTSLYDYSSPLPYYYIGGSNCVPGYFRIDLRTGPFFTDDLGGYTDNGNINVWTPSSPLEPATEYAWGVQGKVGSQSGPYAGYSYFFTGPMCPTEDLVAASLLEPADNATITDLWPSLIWDYPNACLPHGYRIDLSTAEDFSDTSLSGGTGNPSTRWGAGHQLEDCTRYYWKVAPINDTTLGPESATFTFFINATGSCPMLPFDPSWPIFHVEWEILCKIGPGPEFADVSTLAAGLTLQAEGRNTDASWLLMRLNENSQCWIPGNAGTLDGDALSLPLIDTPQIVSTFTPTPVPDCAFTFSEKANCRSGPGTIYDYITSGVPGQAVPVNGRNSDASWYQVSVNGLVCWVRSTLGTYNCNPQALRIITAPPTPTFTPVPTNTPVPCQKFTNLQQCESSRYVKYCYWDRKVSACTNR